MLCYLLNTCYPERFRDEIHNYAIYAFTFTALQYEYAGCKFYLNTSKHMYDKRCNDC